MHTIIHTWENSYPEVGLLQVVETLRKGSADAAPASCSCEQRKLTEGGWLTISQTEGYGTPLARTTTYDYNEQFLVSRINRPDGGYTEYAYDADGRVTKEISPWGNGGKQRTRYVYNAASSRFYDNRPVKVYTDYQEAGTNSWLNIKVVDYTYEDSAAVERTTAVTHIAGTSQVQTTIEESYGEQPAYAYAAGKSKFSQDVNGVQAFHEYESTTLHNAVHKHTSVTKANGALVSAQSRKTEEFIAADGTTSFEQESIWNGTEWLLLNTTAYEYDAFGNVVKQTLALAATPTKDNSPVVEMAYSVESTDEGVFSVTTNTRYNAVGNPLVSVQKSLISNLSDTIESKNLTIDERNLTSTQWVEYHVGTKRKSYNTQPTSNITAEAVTVDGFTLSQTDNAGVTTTNGRCYTTQGMIQTRTDGRGNTTTTVTDKAGRTLTVTDAAGNVTTTVYDSAHNLPATVTDAQGNTTCYRYDVRGRKLAEWGTGMQPACFSYDDADRMTSLTTFRASTETVSTDPSDRTDGDVTMWSYHDASGMEISKTYSDTSSVVKTHDAENRPVSFTNTETNTVIECAYDSMGRRATKKVMVDGNLTLHQRYLYRGYLQIAALDLTRSDHPALWFITWDSTQPIATRPLAIQKDATWFIYGWDLTKNICELYTNTGSIRTSYTYSPYGAVTESGNTWQPIQWSSEYNDAELGLVYYNYRHYNPMQGRWLGRDRIYSLNSYNFAKNSIPSEIDIMGLYARCILLSEMDLSVNPDTKETIDNITDAISHYRGASGKTVYATDALYNEMKSDPSYKERIFGMKTDSLRSKIMFKLLNVSPKETSETISAAPNSYIGRLWCLTLGSYKLDIDYNSKWDTDSDWEQDLIDVICCRYYRFVKVI